MEKKNYIKDKVLNRCSYCLKIPNIKIFHQDSDLDIDYTCHKIKGSIPYEKYNIFFPQILLSKTKCLVCGKYSSETKSFFCVNCKRFFCCDCIEHHNKINTNHIINQIPQSDTKCFIHNRNYNSYCKTCLEDICEECLNYHNSHNIINYNDLIINDLESINKNIENYESIVNIIYENSLQLIDKIKIMNQRFKNQNKFIINLLKINKEIYENQLQKKELNYSIIQNLKQNINFSDIQNKVKELSNLIIKIDIEIDCLFNINILKPEKNLKSQKIEFKKIESKETNNDSIKCVLVLEDGRIATGSKDKTIKIFNINSNSNLNFTSFQEIKATYHVWHMAQLKNSNLICGEDLGIMELFDIKNYSLIHKYENVSTNLTAIWNILILSQSQNILSCCRQGLKIWESTNNYNLIKKLDITLIPNNIAMQNQGLNVMESIFELPNNKIASTSDDSILRFWDIDTYQIICSIDKIGCCSRTGFALISQSSLAIANRYEKKVTIINIVDYEITNIFFFNNDTVCLLYLRDENLLLVGEQNVNDISIIDLNNNRYDDSFHFKNKEIIFDWMTGSVKGVNAIVRMKNGDFITVTYDKLTELWRFVKNN